MSRCGAGARAELAWANGKHRRYGIEKARGKARVKESSMALPREKAWFFAKTFGWGWSFPARWQGWAVFVGCVLAAVGGAPMAKAHRAGYILYVSAVFVVLLTFCCWKGERPRWSWGRD